MILFGTRGVKSTIESGDFNCPQCEKVNPYYIVKPNFFAFIFLFSSFSVLTQVEGHWKIVKQDVPEFKIGYKIIEFNTDSTYYFPSTYNRDSLSRKQFFKVDWELKMIHSPTGKNGKIVGDPISDEFIVELGVEKFVVKKLTLNEKLEYYEMLNYSRLYIDLPVSKQLIVNSKEFHIALKKRKFVPYFFWFSVANTASDFPKELKTLSYRLASPSFYSENLKVYNNRFDAVYQKDVRIRDTAFLYNQNRRYYSNDLSVILAIDKNVPFGDFMLLLREVRQIPVVQEIHLLLEDSTSAEFKMGLLKIEGNQYPKQENCTTYGDWVFNNFKFNVSDNPNQPMELIQIKKE